MLCDRVVKVLTNLCLTKSKCAQELGITHKTLSGYLKPEGQHNLWQYLPTFLEWDPRLSRQWLYFGEGPMFIGLGVPIDQPVPPQAIMRAAEAMAAECNGSWGQVLRKIIDNAREELDQQSASPDASKELAEARAEIARLQKKTEMLLTRTVELQDELLNIHKAEKAEREKRAEKSSAEESVGRAAHTGHTAAHS